MQGSKYSRESKDQNILQEGRIKIFYRIQGSKYTRFKGKSILQDPRIYGILGSKYSTESKDHNILQDSRIKKYTESKDKYILQDSMIKVFYMIKGSKYSSRTKNILQSSRIKVFCKDQNILQKPRIKTLCRIQGLYIHYENMPIQIY